MGPMINFLVFMVLLFTGLAQTNTIPRKLGYTVAGVIAAVTMILAILRYKKDSGPK